ncbi:MAG: TMEM43 family protein [Planctomycetales bacterium]
MGLTEVTNESWFSRLGNSIKSVALGFVMFLAAFPLLWMNEGCSAGKEVAYGEFKKVVKTVPADKVNSANEGQAIHLSGEATTDETLADPEFGVSAEKVIRLNRTVEMYAWEETEHEDKEKKVGGSEDTIKSWSHDRDWVESPQDSSEFEEPEGHENPSMPIRSQSFNASKVTCGAFTLSNSLVGVITKTDQFPPPENATVMAPDVLGDRNMTRATWKDSSESVTGYYVGADSSSHQVGDLRIKFDVVKPAKVTIVAAQSGESFQPWLASNEFEVERLFTGNHSSDQVVKKLLTENTAMTWAGRFLGFALMAIGIGMSFSPLAVVADVLPSAGDLMGGGIFIFSVIVAGALSLVTIGVAWLRFRPLWGIGLLVIAALLIFGARMLLKPKAEPKAV